MNVGLGSVDNTADANKSVKYATSAGSASSATKATQDSSSQTITSTYIKGLSVSGRTITYTRGDNTTGTITTQDTNTTYSVGTSTYSGTTKLYTTTGSNTDGTMTQKAIKEALDGKFSGAFADDHTANYIQFDNGVQIIWWETNPLDSQDLTSYFKYFNFPTAFKNSQYCVQLSVIPVSNKAASIAYIPTDGYQTTRLLVRCNTANTYVYVCCIGFYK